MADMTEMVAGQRWLWWRIAMWGGAALLLLSPAVAMRFGAGGVDWGAEDFIAMAIMLGVACGACELVAWASSSGAYRMAGVIGVGTAFLTVWVNLAVGMIGSEDNPYNLLFGGVLAIGLAGAIVARFEAARMVRAMAVTAVAQALAAAPGLPGDHRGAIFSMLFAIPWLVSAALFRKAAREPEARSESGSG